MSGRVLEPCSCCFPQLKEMMQLAVSKGCIKDRLKPYGTNRRSLNNMNKAGVSVQQGYQIRRKTLDCFANKLHRPLLLPQHKNEDSLSSIFLLFTLSQC